MLQKAMWGAGDIYRPVLHLNVNSMPGWVLVAPTGASNLLTHCRDADGRESMKLGIAVAAAGRPGGWSSTFRPGRSRWRGTSETAFYSGTSRAELQFNVTRGRAMGMQDPR